MKEEIIDEAGLRKRDFHTLHVTSGATTTSVIQDEPLYFLHGGRETDPFELGPESSSVVFPGSIPSCKNVELTDLGRYVWQAQFGRILPSACTVLASQAAVVLAQMVTVLSLGAVDEVSVQNVGKDITSWSAFMQESEPDRLPWRGIFCLAPTNKDVLFSQKVELEIAKLPRWRPHLAIDRHTLERDNE